MVTKDDLAPNREYDVIIIGAGIYGIQSARTYLEIHPNANLIILESGNSTGGVWSHERVYEDFWTQTPLGIAGFSDREVQDVPEKDCYYGFFKAKHMATYLSQYCEDHVYNGRSLASRVKFQSPVSNVSKKDTVWHVQCQDGKSEYRSQRLIDASGLTSAPNWPHLPGRNDFKGELLHHRDFAAWEKYMRPGSEKPKSIAVLGGAKSAADVAYAGAKAGLRVTWIIRRSGSGPAALVSAKGSNGYKNSNEESYTRVASLFLASLFGPAMGCTPILNWLNKTSIGRWLMRTIWQRTHNAAAAEANYDREDGKENGFFNLKPDTELFWQNDSTGVNQRKDFFDVIARKVKVIREDISHLDESGIVLDDSQNTHVDASVMICATGWKVAHPYYSEETAAKLGLPVRQHAQDPETKTHWLKMEHESELDIIKQFPILDSEWAYRQSAFPQSTGTLETPFRLWKSIVPVSDPSIVFLGKLMLGNHFRDAEVQSLFACGILDGRVSMPSKAEMEHSIARTTVWCRRRYLQKGLSGNWFYWDTIPYHDHLLGCLGLSSHRGKSWVQDLFRPAFARDLQGLVPEYIKKQ